MMGKTKYKKGAKFVIEIDGADGGNNEHPYHVNAFKQWLPEQYFDELQPLESPQVTWRDGAKGVWIPQTEEEYDEGYYWKLRNSKTIQWTNLPNAQFENILWLPASEFEALMPKMPEEESTVEFKENDTVWLPFTVKSTPKDSMTNLYYIESDSDEICEAVRSEWLEHHGKTAVSEVHHFVSRSE